LPGIVGTTDFEEYCKATVSGENYFNPVLA
jgi:hypothetical protein